MIGLECRRIRTSNQCCANEYPGTAQATSSDLQMSGGGCWKELPDVCATRLIYIQSVAAPSSTGPGDTEQQDENNHMYVDFGKVLLRSTLTFRH